MADTVLTQETFDPANVPEVVVARGAAIEFSIRGESANRLMCNSSACQRRIGSNDATI